MPLLTVSPIRGPLLLPHAEHAEHYPITLTARHSGQSAHQEYRGQGVRTDSPPPLPTAGGKSGPRSFPPVLNAV